MKQGCASRRKINFITLYGSLQNKGLHLSVYGFTLEDVNLLKTTLENLFAPEFLIKCTIHNHKSGYRLYF